MQTVLGHLLPTFEFLDGGSLSFLRLSDGDQLAIEYFEGDQPTVALLFHGLNGSTQSNYMQRAAKVIRHLGYSVALINHRDCGQGRGLARHPYHCGRGDDVSDVIQHFRKIWPRRRIVAIGFSLGASALLNLLCGLRGHCLPDLALVINGPLDLKACSDALSRGLNRIYDLHFYVGCRREVMDKVHADRLALNTRLPYLSRLRTIDEKFTAPYSGFKDALQYYANCSTHLHLEKIKTPTIMITNKRDPFIPYESYLPAKNNPHIHLHLEETGGHLGYLQSHHKTPWRLSQQRWLDHAIAHYLRN